VDKGGNRKLINHRKNNDPLDAAECTWRNWLKKSEGKTQQQ